MGLPLTSSGVSFPMDSATAATPVLPSPALPPSVGTAGNHLEPAKMSAAHVAVLLVLRASFMCAISQTLSPHNKRLEDLLTPKDLLRGGQGRLAVAVLRKQLAACNVVKART